MPPRLKKRNSEKKKEQKGSGEKKFIASRAIVPGGKKSKRRWGNQSNPEMKNPLHADQKKKKKTNHMRKNISGYKAKAGKRPPRALSFF